MRTHLFVLLAAAVMAMVTLGGCDWVSWPTSHW
jgi:hypothetical protein